MIKFEFFENSADLRADPELDDDLAVQFRGDLQVEVDGVYSLADEVDAAGKYVGREAHAYQRCVTAVGAAGNRNFFRVGSSERTSDAFSLNARLVR